MLFSLTRPSMRKGSPSPGCSGRVAHLVGISRLGEEVEPEISVASDFEDRGAVGEAARRAVGGERRRRALVGVLERPSVFAHNRRVELYVAEVEFRRADADSVDPVHRVLAVGEGQEQGSVGHEFRHDSLGFGAAVGAYAQQGVPSSADFGCVDRRGIFLEEAVEGLDGRLPDSLVVLSGLSLGLRVCASRRSKQKGRAQQGFQYAVYHRYVSK